MRRTALTRAGTIGAGGKTPICADLRFAEGGKGSCLSQAPNPKTNTLI
ncbi:hypothetical protein [Actibacterium sp.]